MRTGAIRYQKPVPDRLATPQHVRPSRIEEASLYSSRACGKGLFCSFPAENISWIDRSPDRYNLSAIAGSGQRLRNSRGQPTRSEARRVGKECVSNGRSRWWSDHEKKKITKHNRKNKK